MLTFILIVVNILVFSLPYVVNFQGPFDSFTNFLMLGWKDNAAIREGEYYRLVTSNFLHADITHLMVNMLSLYNVGPYVNSIFGNLGFLLIFFASGIGSSFTSFWFNQNPSVGASGAIFGLVGSLCAVAIATNNFALLANIGIVILINASIGFLTPNIDNWGHFGGFVIGLITGAILLLISGLNGGWNPEM
jgi:Uncharacterized membrane protein (homolog of Drosophila rhomboid)